MRQANVPKLSYCLLVPHFNHFRQLQKFFPELHASGLPLIVVDDGSDAENIAALHKLVSQYDDVELLECRPNRGKGFAIVAGLRHALQCGYSHAVQIDADGQHNINDVQKMVALSGSEPDAIVSGLPVFGDDIPRARMNGRKVSLFFVRLETLSMQLKDAMCGFRVYPVAATTDLCLTSAIGQRMQFDLEVLVRWVWRGERVAYAPTAVCYPDDGRSHFRMLRDNIQISWMHTKLVVGMLVRSPLLIYRKFNETG